jgi:hypothetical protein
MWVLSIYDSGTQERARPLQLTTGLIQYLSEDHLTTNSLGETSEQIKTELSKYLEPEKPRVSPESIEFSKFDGSIDVGQAVQSAYDTVGSRHTEIDDTIVTG